MECVRLSLERLVVGRRIKAVRVSRADVITGRADKGALLVGDKVSRVLRHGKQLAIVGNGGRCICVHLGMSGQLCVMGLERTGATLKERTTTGLGSRPQLKSPAHTHVLWQFDGNLALRFTDPRRFGGLWTYANEDDLLAQRWSVLGHDALRITPGQFSNGLAQTRRSLKAALMDQHLVAGLGNIYVDELLFNAKLHPLMPACEVAHSRVPGLVRQMKTLLAGAILRGGSSLRDYVDGANQQGSQQTRHRVYGRAGMPCKRRGCRGTIHSEQVAGRTTAWCPSCQGLG